MLGVLKRWRPAALFGSWLVYWIALALVTLGPALVAMWKATHAGAGKGNISLTFSNGVFSLVVDANGQSLYTGAAHLLTIALLAAGPPLVLWALWFAARSRGAPKSRKSAIT